MEILQTINVVSITVRLLLALVCGGLLGWERENKRRPAGFRTYMLVCMGSALVMITSQYIFENFYTGDLLRMGAQVISGIGFLGAGTIIVTGRKQVKGLTTAAGLWAVACLGLAVGIGFYSGALIACGLIFAVMTLFHWLEARIGRSSRVLNLYVELCSVAAVGRLLTKLRTAGLKASEMEITKNKTAESGVAVLLSIQRLGKSHEDIIHLLSAVDGVEHIEEY